MKLSDLISPPFLRRLQSLFASYLGTSLMITDVHGTPLIEPISGVRMCSLVRNTPRGEALCESSDRHGGQETLLSKETHIYRCFAGFIDFSAAIVFRGEVIGLLVGGQTKTGTEKPDHLRKLSEETGVPLQELEHALREMPCVNEDSLREQLHFIKRMTELLCDLASLYYEQHLKDMKVVSDAKARIQIAEDVRGEFERQLKTISQALDGSVDLAGKYGTLYEELEEMSRKAVSLKGTSGDSDEYQNCSDEDYRIREVTYELHWVLSRVRASYGEKIHIPETAALRVPPYLCGDPAAISDVMNRILLFMTASWPDQELLIGADSRQDDYAALITIRVVSPGYYASDEELHQIQNALGGMIEQLPEGRVLEYLDLTTASTVAKKLSADLSCRNRAGEGFCIEFAVPQLPAKGGFY